MNKFKEMQDALGALQYLNGGSMKYMAAVLVCCGCDRCKCKPDESRLFFPNSNGMYVYNAQQWCGCDKCIKA